MKGDAPPRLQLVPRERAMSVRMVLRDPVQASYLMRFLEEDHADENGAFFRDLESFRKCDSAEEKKAFFVALYRLYIVEGAPSQINLASPTRKKIDEFANSGKLEGPELDHVFDDAEVEVLDMLRFGPFSRFLDSIFYDAMERGVERRGLVDEEQFARFEKLCKDDDPKLWKKKEKKEGLLKFDWLGKEDLISVKARLVIQRSAEAVFSIVSDFSQRVRFDAMLSRVDVLEDCGAYKTLRLLFDVPSRLMKDRVAVVAVLSTRTPDGKFGCFMRSVAATDEVINAPAVSPRGGGLSPSRTGGSSPRTGNSSPRKADLSSSRKSNISTTMEIPRSSRRNDDNGRSPSPRPLRADEPKSTSPRRSGASVLSESDGDRLLVELDCAGYLVEPLSRDTCLVTYLVSTVNAKYAPMLVKRVTKARVNTLVALRKYAEDEKNAE